jgi:glycosyltransferase involved in cell wall biosynthesis
MKDHATFLRAASLLAQERTDVRFVCVGDGPAEACAQLQSLAETLGISHKVVWTGLRTDMPKVYNALDLLCSSSYGEGSPNVIGEALACGVPCVVTDVGDCAELLGPFGVVTPPMDPRALTDGFRTLLKAQRVPHVLHQYIVDHFGVERLITVTEQWLTLQRQNEDKPCA